MLKTNSSSLEKHISSISDSEIFRTDERCEQVLSMFSLFSNRFRFKILCVLKDGDLCVNEIAARVGGKSSNVSQQLKMLTLAGYLSRRREEKSVYYSLADQKIKKLMNFLYDLFGKDES